MNETIANQTLEAKTDAAEDAALVESVDQQPPSDGGEASTGSSGSAIEWLAFNLALFVLYIGFFHLCLVTQFPISLAIGVVIAAAMSYLCVRFYRLFANRYEFLFYLALPLDVVLEGLIPFHSGYSFYWCAASFWLVFGIYRIYRMSKKA